MADDVKRSERIRDDRAQDLSKQPVKPRPKETEFDKLLERNQITSKLNPQTQTQSKTLTEEAIKEAVKHDERGRDERQKDSEEKDHDRDGDKRSEKRDIRGVEQKVVAKGRLKDDRGGSSSHGESGKGGYGSQHGRKDVSKILNKMAAKSVPVDLQGKFASKMAQALKAADQSHQTGLPQQVLNKLIQFVKIGINSRGEKEMQIALSEHIFRGLRLRVVAKEGKVGVHLKLIDKKGKKIFENNKEAIMKTLKDKGIEVDEFEIS